MELRRYWEIIIRRKWILIQSILLVPLFTYILLKSISPIYKCDAKLWVKVRALQQSFISDMPKELGRIEFSDISNAMGTMEEILTSDSVVGRVIREMNLRDEDGDLYQIDDFISPGKITLIFQKKGVKIEHVLNSEIFEIRGYSSEPFEAKEITDKVVNVFLEAFSEMYKKEAAEARRVMEDRFIYITKKLTAAEKVLDEYKTNSKVFDTSAETKSLLTEISNLESEKKLLYETDLAQLKAEKTPEHPDVIIAQKKVAIVEEQIKERRKRFNELPKKDRKLDELKREIDYLRSIYNTMAHNIEVTKSAMEMNLSNAQIIQSASINENVNKNIYFPSSRKVYPVTVAALLGCFFGLFIVFFMEYLDNSIWTPRDVEKTLDQEVIGVIPKVSRNINKNRVENSFLADRVYNLISNIRLFKGRELSKVVSIISPMRRDGKSLFAASVTTALAHEERKVLLIDGNLRHPFLHKLFNIINIDGISDYLLGDIEIQGIKRSSVTGNLDVVTGGSYSIVNPQKYLDSDRFSALIRAFLEDYSIIFIDTPAYVDGSDALIISRYAEDILFIVSQGETNKKVARDFIDTIGRAKMNVLGVVLNKVKDTL